jgi:hypothetical protein
MGVHLVKEPSYFHAIVGMRIGSAHRAPHAQLRVIVRRIAQDDEALLLYRIQQGVGASSLSAWLAGMSVAASGSSSIKANKGSSGGWDTMKLSP